MTSSLGGAITEKSAAEVEAQFESMFTEEAEKSQVNRDLSQLSDAKRSLVSQMSSFTNQ